METELCIYFPFTCPRFKFSFLFFVVVVSFAHPEVSLPLKVPHIQPTHTHISSLPYNAVGVCLSLYVNVRLPDLLLIKKKTAS